MSGRCQAGPWCLDWKVFSSRWLCAQVMLAAALQLTNSSGSAHPQLVDRWPCQLQGQVAGGVLMAMVTHPVAGRAVLCVSTKGLAALCPQFL